MTVKPWEEDFGPEEEFLYLYGFSRFRALNGTDLWQHGRGGELESANVYTRQQAFEFVAGLMDTSS
jgi:hypothetical protein